MKRQKHIELFKGRGKKPYRYRVVAANGEYVGTSQGYTRRSSARRGAVRNVGNLPIVVQS